MYYNNSKITKSEGVGIYIKDDINEDTEVIEIDKLKILHTY